MKQTCVFLIFLIMFSVPAVIAADEVKTGRISGTMMIKDGGPMADGLVLFFSDAAGPPPLEDRYMRFPENGSTTDQEGKFSIMLPEGKYFIGGMKHMTGKWSGPPREGDLFFINKDENGTPVVYTVENGGQTDIGTVTGSVPDKREFDDEGITAIEGTIYERSGNPIEDVVVFAEVRPGSREGLAFMSGYTRKDGIYKLRVHKGDTYYLYVMGEWGNVFPGSGMFISIEGKDQSSGITVQTGEVKKNVDIKLKIP